MRIMGREDHARKAYPSDLTDEPWAIVAPASERSQRDRADADRHHKEDSMGVVNHPCVRRGNTRGIVSHDTLWANRDACFLLPGGRAGRLRHTTFVVLQGLLAVWLLAGCASAPTRVLSTMAPSYATLPNGSEPLHPTQVSPIYAAVTAIPGDNLVRYLERQRGHALNLLSLSGGGQNVAFGAGVLVGWRESGRRPQFDVVGGVSTGALLATHALLGTPADDAALERMYTGVTKGDIYKDRGLFSLLAGADSLADTAPLQALLVKYITPETLQREVEAYD